MTKDELEQEEEALRTQVADLPQAERKAYYHQLDEQLKDPDTYAVLNYFFVAGLHHFYLGKTGRGVLNLVVMAIGLLLIESVGIALILLVIVIELPQLFRSQRIVREYNLSLSRTILAQFR
ncbi:hypothetical protein HMF8227_00647 [Saliniradius amylolyticus]|uniref:TM2 domain-containing protein n=1 Tax=Saliniradius amylolyticus TaxID=2183582 RepID=A0A2S2E0J4_9ALTE|nr:hypothetical protein [Saliniradius amylolyticus]AWL11143.1 hypothetical protein HMF8227_00647 [Saliniradius amylolyticus]